MKPTKTSDFSRKYNKPFSISPKTYVIARTYRELKKQ